MATKVQEVKEKKQLAAQERELAVKKKLEKADKVKFEVIKYQKEKTAERLKKWEERKQTHEAKLTVKLNKLAKESNKYTKKYGDILMQEKEKQLKEQDGRHMLAYNSQLRDREAYDQKEIDREIKADRFGVLKTIDSKIAKADSRRKQHLEETSKKHRDHAEHVLNRYEYQQGVDLEKYEDKYSKTVLKDLKTKKTLKEIKLDRKDTFLKQMVLQQCNLRK